MKYRCEANTEYSNGKLLQSPSWKLHKNMKLIVVCIWNRSGIIKKCCRFECYKLNFNYSIQEMFILLLPQFCKTHLNRSKNLIKNALRYGGTLITSNWVRHWNSNYNSEKKLIKQKQVVKQKLIIYVEDWNFKSSLQWSKSDYNSVLIEQVELFPSSSGTSRIMVIK